MKMLLIGLALSIIMVGCTKTQTQENVNADYSRFIKSSKEEIDGKSYIVAKDKNTGVEYLIVYDTNYCRTGISVTPLYKADGTLKTD